MLQVTSCFISHLSTHPSFLTNVGKYGHLLDRVNKIFQYSVSLSTVGIFFNYSHY